VPDVELEVRILNLVYKLRGFQAIEELKAWLDEHASECRNEFAGEGVMPQ
jgi:hypothetical protein